MMRKRKWLIIGVGAAVLAAAGIAWASGTHGGKSGAPGGKGAAAKAETARVEKRSVSDDIEVSGNLKPSAEQDIRAPSDGIVDEVFVREGQRVKKGDPIAALDSTAARYELAKLAYEIDQESFAGNRRKVDLLKGELEVRKRAVDDLTIRAHLDGTVSSIDLKPGDVLKVGTTYGRVIDVRTLIADVQIAEVDIPRAKQGLPVEFRFPALPGLTAAGRLESFASEARITDQKLTVLDAKLVIDQPPRGLLPAFSFNAVIKAGGPRDVLVVDSRAVSYEGGKPHVQRLKADGQTERVDVETEGFGSGLIRVLTGLAEGDELVIPGPAAGAGS
jgi:multidrug efflux pump subunit AcrA (membrane-fusion protein)